MDHHVVENPLSRAMLAAEESSGLDSLAELLQPVLDLVAANRTVMALLEGRWLGHALHPVLTAAPLGAWISAIALDVLRPPGAEDSARFLTGLGVVTAVPTALTGVAELADEDRPILRVGAAHVACNVASLGLQSVSWLKRRAGKHSTGRVLSLLAGALVTVGGYFGGHLSMGRQVSSRDQVFEPPLLRVV